MSGQISPKTQSLWRQLHFYCTRRKKTNKPVNNVRLTQWNLPDVTAVFQTTQKEIPDYKGFGFNLLQIKDRLHSLSAVIFSSREFRSYLFPTTHRERGLWRFFFLFSGACASSPPQVHVNCMQSTRARQRRNLQFMRLPYVLGSHSYYSEQVWALLWVCDSFKAGKGIG